MIPVCSVGFGWTLWADVNGDQIVPVVARFVHKDGTRRTPVEIARLEPSFEAREIFRRVKRRLDIADRERANPGHDSGWRALDVAKIAMQIALKDVGRWDDSLLENEVAEEAL